MGWLFWTQNWYFRLFLFFLAIGQAFQNNRSVAIARKDIDLADDGQGQMVHGLLVSDSVDSHGFSTKIRTGFIG